MSKNPIEENPEEKKANNKFLDRVIIFMLVSIGFFTVAWTVLNVIGISIQPEIIIGYFAFWGAEGGISAIITIKKNKIRQQENYYNMGYSEPTEIFYEPEQPEESENLND